MLYKQGIILDWLKITDFLEGLVAASLTNECLDIQAIDAFMQVRLEFYNKNLEKIAVENPIIFQILQS